MQSSRFFGILKVLAVFSSKRFQKLTYYEKDTTVTRKPKLEELDLVRAFAISAVLLIHGTADATVDVADGSRSLAIYIAINRLSIFAVPVFILLSGLVLFYAYADGWRAGRTLSFYRKRLQYVIVPYLIWSFFYYLYYPAILPDIDVRVDPAEFLRLILGGNASYHLYFIVIIAQFYVLFPLLVSAAAKWSGFARRLWLFGIAVQLIAYIGEFAFGESSHRASLCVTYFGLFCIGGSIGMRYERFVAWIDRNIWWVTALATAVGFTFVLIVQLSRYDVKYHRIVYDLLFNVYPVLVAASLIWISRQWFRTRSKWAVRLSAMGAASFGIYFIHPALLALWKSQIGVAPTGLAYHVATLGGIALIFVVPWTIVGALKKFKGSWILFGK